MDDATEHGTVADGRSGGIGRRMWVRSVALVGGGLVAGGILAGTLSANAATDTSTATSAASSTSQESGAPTGNTDPSQPQRSDEQLLTGDTATKVTDAALAKYPDATIQRVETDSDGVYEAHLVTADGQRVTVEVDKTFAITGEEAGGHGGHGGPGGPDDDDADDTATTGTSGV